MDSLSQLRLRSSEELILEVRSLQGMLGHPSAPDGLEERIVAICHELNNRWTAERLNRDCDAYLTRTGAFARA
jgi:hypothetical protein